MKQFNLENYNRLVAEGKTPKMVTRDGRSARIICTDKKGNFPVVAAILESDNVENLRVYMDNGVYSDLEGLKSPCDLFFADIEPAYRPYKDVEECFKDVVKHGGWVKEKDTEFYYHVIRIDADGFCYTGDACESFQDMLNEHVWADDGSPCGVKEE